MGGSIMEKLLYSVIAGLLTNYVSGAADRIAGGKPAKKGQFPYFVQIIVLSLYENDQLGADDCGGTLIHPQWVLTAAHCFKEYHMIPAEKFKKGMVRAYMGTEKVVLNNLDDLKLPHKLIHKAYTHNRYVFKEVDDSDVIFNDVAVAVLKQPFKLNNYIQTIKLPDLKTKICRQGTIIGGGMVDFSGKYSDTLQYANVNAKTRQELSELPASPRPTVFYTEVQFYKGHTLDGDSGGPFLCNLNSGPIQIGILSAGSNSSRQTSIDEYELVTKHLKFITKYVRLGKQGKQTRSKEVHKHAANKPQTKSRLVWPSAKTDNQLVRQQETKSDSVRRKSSYIVWYTNIFIYIECALFCKN